MPHFAHMIFDYFWDLSVDHLFDVLQHAGGWEEEGADVNFSQSLMNYVDGRKLTEGASAEFLRGSENFTKKVKLSSIFDYVSNGIIPKWHKNEIFPKWHKLHATVALEKSRTIFS